MKRHAYFAIGSILLTGAAWGAPQEPAQPLPAAPQAAAAQPATGHNVHELRISGANHVNPAALRNLCKTQPGQVYDPAVLEKDIQAIETFYRRNGYPLAHVTSGYGINAHGVVTLPIDEGRIEGINIKGLKKTKRYVVLRELESRRGQVYSTNQVAEDRKRLYDLGFFGSVSISPAAGNEPGTALLDVDLKERETGSVNAAMGYTSSSGMVGFAQWSDSNFFGTGQTVSLNWQRGAYTSLLRFDNNGSTQYDTKARAGFDLGYYAPWVFRRGLNAGLRLYDTSTTQAFYFSQDVDPGSIKTYEWRRGTWLTLGRQVGRGITLGFLGRSEHVDYNVAPLGVDAPAGEYAGPTRVRSVRFSASRGPVNPFYEQSGVPRTGVSLELGNSDHGTGSSSYQKLGLIATHYLPFSKRNTLATRLQLGWSGGDLPFSELYAVGGAQTVRSYQYNRFLGTRMAVLNAELRHDLKRGMVLAGFLDLGNAWGRGQQFSLGGLRPAVGLGMRLATPFGPIRLDYAVGNEGGRAHLTMGDPF